MPSPLRVATRGSELARWQALEVVRRLEASGAGLKAEIVVIQTAGDRQRDVPVWEMGGQGVFVKEVQAAVIDGDADVAVHSAKDLPALTPVGLQLAAIPVRADPRDALVGSAFGDLGPGATVATGSVRRRAQLSWLRPDLTFKGLRGNIGTRLERVPPGGAAVVAAAALERLGLLDRAAEILSPEVMLPQVGQGAIAVECRESDGEVREALMSIDDGPAHAAVRAERGFLAQLGAGCELPVGAWAAIVEAELRIEALIASPDGRVMLRAGRSGSPDHAHQIGAEVAAELLAAGGAGLMAEFLAGPAPVGP